MPPSDLLATYANFASNLGIDLVAILAMTYVLSDERRTAVDDARLRQQGATRALAPPGGQPQAVYTDEAALTAELERRLGGHVVFQEIERIDLVHDHLTVDVRLRPGPAAVPAQRLDEPATPTDTPPVDAAVAGGVDEVVPRALSVEGASADSRDISGRHRFGLDQTD